MDAAEHLLEDVESGRLYPEDFIVYRITSTVPTDPERRPRWWARRAADLVNFIQRLSWSDLPATATWRGGGHGRVADRPRVSRRTLQRCRRMVW